MTWPLGNRCGLFYFRKHNHRLLTGATDGCMLRPIATPAMEQQTDEH